MSFPCERCGACCRAIKCRHLEGRNHCTVYDTRPEVCRVDDMITRLGGDREELYRVTKLCCEKLRAREGKQWLGL
jgi:Fe-S-cluster containining protein